MEAQYKTKDGRLFIKIDAETPKELFKRIASVQEVFEAEAACGCCQSKEIRFQVRTVDKNDYYELKCSCGARFQFGQNKEGGSLFPKRRDEAVAALPNNGWAKYQPMTAPVEPKAAETVVLPAVIAGKTTPNRVTRSS